MIAYGPVRHFPWVDFDDRQNVFANPHVLAGLNARSFQSAFTSQTVGIWEPLTILSYLMEVRLFGVSAGEMHLMNVLLHALSAAGWYVLLRGMTGRRAPSLFLAGLFGLHPAHVESVAWISERKDVLSMLMLVLSLIAYRRYTVGPRLVPYCLSVSFLALALLSKPIMVTQPILLMLLDLWPLGRTKWWRSISPTASQSSIGTVRLIAEKIPFVILALLASLIALKTQGMEGTYSDIHQLPLGQRLFSCTVAYVRYLKMAFVPTQLAVYYPYQHHIPPAAVLVSLMLLIIASAMVFRFRKRQPWLLVGWLWYVSTLLPVIGLVQVGSQAMADRYTYLPFIGLFAAVIWPIASMVEKDRALKIVAGLLGCGVLTTCAFLTRLDLGCWTSTLALFQQAAIVNVAPDPMIEFHLGEACRDAGHPELAVDHYERALRMDSRQFGSNLSLGNLLMNGFPELALPHLENAVASDPRSYFAHRDYGICLRALHKNAAADEQFKMAGQLRD